jgi:cell division initiation protein
LPNGGDNLATHTAGYQKQEFKRMMRGYDPDEVNAFLEMVAEELEVLQREKNRLEDEALKLRTQLHDYQEVERTLKQTLMNAQETVQLSRDNSKREADLLLREAELQAEKIIEGARLKLAQLKNDLQIVRAQKDSFARRLHHLLESQLKLIDVLELDDLNFGENDHRDNNLAVMPPERLSAETLAASSCSPGASRATKAGVAQQRSGKRPEARPLESPVGPPIVPRRRRLAWRIASLPKKRPANRARPKKIRKSPTILSHDLRLKRQ